MKHNILTGLCCSFLIIFTNCESLVSKQKSQLKNHTKTIFIGKEVFTGKYIEYLNWHLAPHKEIKLNKNSYVKLLSLLSKSQKGETYVPFVGYKQYWIIPEKNIIVGILNSDYGFHVWSAKKSKEGYEKASDIIISGSPSASDLFLKIVNDSH
jgi:hypothetical protein